MTWKNKWCTFKINSYLGGISILSLIINVLTILLIFVVSYYLAKTFFKIISNKVHILNKERHQFDKGYIMIPAVILISVYLRNRIGDYFSVEFELLTSATLTMIIVTFFVGTIYYIYYQITERFLMIVLLGLFYTVLSGIVIIIKQLTF